MFCKKRDFRFFVEYSGKHLRWSLFFNPIQNRRGGGGGAGRWGKKAPCTSFFPVISTKVRITPKIFLTFNFNPFATLMQNFTFVPSVSPNLLNLNQDHPSKKRFFWSNPCKIEVMITSLTEMLEFPNFGHMTTSAMNLNHDIKICW